MPKESLAARRRRAARIVAALARAYPDARIELRYRTPFQLLVATILSAQCTDRKVNEVTRELFRRYGTPRKLAEADPAEIEALVRPTGFFRQKARAIQGAARVITERFGGRVPRTLEELVSLPGVARKTANVVLGAAFGIPALAVDTHMKRVNQRLGLVQGSDPVKIERELQELIPREEWTAYSLRVIHHGRVCCTARHPRCDICPLAELCPWPARARTGRAPGAARTSGPEARRSRIGDASSRRRRSSAGAADR